MINSFTQLTRACSVTLTLCFGFITSTALADDMGPSDFDLATYKGKVVYLDFWASWCGPCRATFPLMNELQQRYPDDLAVIAVNLDHKRADAERFLKKLPASFQILYDPQGELAAQYELPGMPTSFYFDREGNAAGRHVGFRILDRKLIEQSIEELVNNKP
ncbi:MAG: TlpA family protein disulfide reductase [Pseudomonadales bacterium]